MGFSSTFAAFFRSENRGGSTITGASMSQQAAAENVLLNVFGQANYWLMGWANEYWWPVIGGMIFIGCLIGMAPLSTTPDHRFHEWIFVWIRKAILYFGLIMIVLPFIMLYIYDMTTYKQLADSQGTFLSWFINLGKRNAYTILIWAAGGLLTRFLIKRYWLPVWSAILRKLRNQQTDETPTDIRSEVARFVAKNFLPTQYYSPLGLFVGLDSEDKPLYVPWEMWYEMMMQIIGSTGYGKGVLQGCILDQIILRGDTLFFVDPKEDKFAPHIMFQRCQELGRKFYYVSLREGEVGSWAPFAGGTPEDAFSRLTSAFKIELTGEPKTDYYKRQELARIKPIMSRTRRIEGIYNEVIDYEESSIKAELELWREYPSLNPSKKGGFSIEKAIKENAVVYLKGSLDDPVLKTATKVFIVELMQEIKRLDKSGEKQKHCTVMVDEVSFLVSKQLKEALATIRGFGANLALAYQSPKDLELVDDVTIDGKALRHSVDQNCQLRLIYGGSDFETAEWVANMSGTIIKEVTKMEKTDVSATGGETWENQRTVGALEENFITTNTVLALPKKVCAFVMPQRLVTIAHTSFIPVKSMSALPEYLARKEKSANIKAEDTPSESIESNDEIDSMGFIEDHENDDKIDFSHAKIDNPVPAKATKAAPKSEPKPAKPVADKKPEAKEATTTKEPVAAPQPQAKPEIMPPVVPTQIEPTDSVSSEEEEKRKARNKARKERQKAKKAAAVPGDQQQVSHAKNADENSPEEPDNKHTEAVIQNSTEDVIQPLEGLDADDFDFTKLKLKDDSDTLASLKDED